MKKTIDIIIQDVFFTQTSIVIIYNGLKNIYAWLESKNKHYPDVLSLSVNNSHNTIIIDLFELKRFIDNSQEHALKLSVSTATKRVLYTIIDRISSFRNDNIIVDITENNIYFLADNTISPTITSYVYYDKEHDQLDTHHINNEVFYNIEKLPISTLNIGSCFSRSIFRSNEYFNPSYKKYFLLKKTVFHNSFISLFSNRVLFDFSQIEDLSVGDAAKYVGIEFTKDMDSIFFNGDYQLVVIDNYINATCPVIQYGNESYLTYNKYLSESIFKRLFYLSNVVYPGTEEYLQLYRKSIFDFHNLLEKYNIRNIVLIGGRLSKVKIDTNTLQTGLWNDKMKWITEVNRNWDAVDKIFLDEFPNSFYIDKRSTSWKSDIHSPIIGGASPSHYQKEYYKEIFEDMLDLLGDRNIYGRRKSY